jgi:outer membrane receptor protein involved in Fe transport
MKACCRYCIFLVLTSPLSLFAQKTDSSSAQLQTVIVTASKSLEKRVEAPLAISVLGPNLVRQTSAPRIDYLLNKVSGVYMPSIGGEQHMMSIRQPISLKGLYLYLEDGLPIRTSGLFSSNALIEINNANIHAIEVIKGPASALYGAEAIGGVVNFLSPPPVLKKEATLSAQVNSTGFKKIDFHIATPLDKGGWHINATIINQKYGQLEYTDYNKNALSIKKEFQVTKKLSGYQSLHLIHYFAQMTGSVDSIHFANKDFRSQQSFTNRKIDLIRWRQNLVYKWGSYSTTSLNLLYRSNTMDQNPTYSIASTINPLKFKGQINSNHFDAYVIDLQQNWTIKKWRTKINFGGYLDITQQNLIAHYIDILKDTSLNKYISYSQRNPDSLITSYHTQINNKAAYVNIISSISNKVKINATLRYDQFVYDYQNKLKIGTPSSLNNFTKWTPKVGMTYNKASIGGYANYSQGFVPPQITEIYNAIRVPYLLPQQFYNYEVGGWFQVHQLFGEVSLYVLNGENEIISVRQTDGVNLNQNAGSTNHTGIEYQFKLPIHKNIWLTLNGTNARHIYKKTIIKGADVSGKIMSAAPSNTYNLSINWIASKKLNLSAEWLHQSKYFMDEINATTYPGFNVLNCRINYDLNKHGFWLHILNATDTYYSTMATKNFSVKGNAAYSYYIGEPRSISIGWRYKIY